MPGCAEKLHERLVRNTCENVILAALHPRSSIQIILQQLHNAGGQLACCINASCLALLEAAIPLQCMVAAVSCVIDAEGKIHVDPKLQVELNAPVHMTFAFDSKSLSVLTTSATGSFSEEQFQSCLSECKKSTQQIFDFYRNTFKKTLSIGNKKKFWPNHIIFSSGISQQTHEVYDAASTLNQPWPISRVWSWLFLK